MPTSADKSHLCTQYYRDGLVTVQNNLSKRSGSFCHRYDSVILKLCRADIILLDLLLASRRYRYLSHKFIRVEIECRGVRCRGLSGQVHVANEDTADICLGAVTE